MTLFVNSKRGGNMSRLSGGKETYKSNHVPSKIDPNTLYNFTTDLKWLLNSLERKMLSPRYNDEDISYLKIQKHKSVLIPMKCFCDINISKLSHHMEWYGDYGIAFDKEWGISNGLQPVQYINANSNLRNDMSEVLKTIFNKPGASSNPDFESFVLHELLYYKPYQGRVRKNGAKTLKNKCFADEHEWRYIPNTDLIGMPQIVFDNSDCIKDFNDALFASKELSLISLKFNYSDIKHVVVNSDDDYQKIVEAINRWDIDEKEKFTILSRVIVWNKLIGDI